MTTRPYPCDLCHAVALLVWIGGAALVCAFWALVIMWLGGALLDLSAATGPNCPGADPSWLGWCRHAPMEAR